MTNPRQDVFDMDPEMNNPLSLKTEVCGSRLQAHGHQPVQNPWQQYFADVELRDCINKDVERT